MIEQNSPCESGLFWFFPIYVVSGHTNGFSEYIMITSYDKAEDECYETMYMFGTGQQTVWEKKGCL